MNLWDFLTEEEKHGGTYSIKVRKSITKYKTKTERKQEIIKYFANCGWKSNFVKNKFKRYTDENFIAYESIEDIIRNFAILWFDDKKETTFLNKLIDCGLCNNVVDNVMTIIEHLLDTSYSTIQLFDIVLNIVCNKINMLKPETQRFYFENIDENTWKKNKYWNFNFNYEIPPNQIEVILGKCLDLSKITLFYHATSWSNSLYIARDGVNNRYGCQCLDFGYTPSFYTSPNVDDALDWAERNYLHWKKECAILVYAVPILNNMNIKVFESATNEWSKLVTLSRRCNKKYQNELDKYDFVFGPMLQKPDDIIYNNKSARPHMPLKNQLACKNDAASKFLDKCYVGTIWLEKSKK